MEVVGGGWGLVGVHWLGQAERTPTKYRRQRSRVVTGTGREVPCIWSIRGSIPIPPKRVA